MSPSSSTLKARRSVGLHAVLGGFFSLAVVAILAVPVARAELTWARTTVQVTGDASAPTLDAHFKFANTGNIPVEIRNVESSCGCTTAALEKRVYQPQESGEIVAKYTPGTHTGEQKKTLLVVTGDGNPPTTLTLVAQIPEILRITPNVVTWSHNEATKPKTMTLEWLPEPSMEDIRVESSAPNVKAEIGTVNKGRKYTLSVAPLQTERFQYAKLTIHCRIGSEEKTFIAYATVKPPTGER